MSNAVFPDTHSLIELTVTMTRGLQPEQGERRSSGIADIHIATRRRLQYAALCCVRGREASVHVRCAADTDHVTNTC